MFFPKILQGPIQKAGEFLAELKEEHPITWANIGNGLWIFLFGFIKKMVIADRLGLFVNNVYEKPLAYSGATLLLVLFAYPIQIYCDFSGYTDMAIGVARAMGYDLCSNFNLPYMARSIAEFWRRWHMSLNAWFRDYLFYPVVRSRLATKLRKRVKTRSKKAAANIPTLMGLAVVWPLMGLWHGASWNFIVFGCGYGILMMLEILIPQMNPKGRAAVRALDIWRWVRTMLITAFMFLIFRADSFATVGVILMRLFTWARGISYLYTWAFLFIALVMGAMIYAYYRNHGDGYYVTPSLGRFRYKLAFCVTLVLAVIFMYVGENYFIYFQF